MAIGSQEDKEHYCADQRDENYEYPQAAATGVVEAAPLPRERGGRPRKYKTDDRIPNSPKSVSKDGHINEKEPIGYYGTYEREHPRYSDRLALPLKSPYFLSTAKYVFMVPSRLAVTWPPTQGASLRARFLLDGPHP